MSHTKAASSLRAGDALPGRVLRALLGVLLLFASAREARAAWDVTIVSGGTGVGGSWAGNTWVPSAAGSAVPASEVQTHLADGPTVISTGSGGTERGNLCVEAGIAWSANTLTFSAANDIDIDAPLTGTGAVALTLEYGQGGVAAGNTARYRITVPVKFNGMPRGTGAPHISITRGSDGVALKRAEPLCSGRPGGCPFLKNSPATLDIEYAATEVDVAADSIHWIHLDWRKDFDTYFPYVMGCVQGAGDFYYPRNQEQKSYFDATGAITDLAGMERTTTTTRFCKDFADGPVLSLLSFQDFSYGYYLRYQPTAGESGVGYNTMAVLVTRQAEANDGYKVYDFVVNVHPAGQFPDAVGLPPPGNALDFDGTDDYAAVPDSDPLDLTASYTIEAWLNPDELKWLGGIVSKYTVWGAGGFTLRLGANGGHAGVNFDGVDRRRRPATRGVAARGRRE